MSHPMFRTLGRPSGRSIAAVALVAVVLIAASSALAFWRTTGTGSGSGTTSTTQAVTLSPGTPTVGLYPGGQGDVALTVDNPNSVHVKIGSLSLSTGQGTAGYAVDGGHAGCATSALSFTTQTNAGAGWTVPAKVGSTDGSLSIDLPNAVALSASAANACQGASFTVYLTAGP
jgi:hypothetical protein